MKAPEFDGDSGSKSKTREEFDAAFPFTLPLSISHREHSTFNIQRSTFNKLPGRSRSEFNVECSMLNVPISGLSLRRFRPALAAIIEFRNERPALIRSSVLTGALLEVRGPFLSSGDWWDRDRWAREEWDVQANDGALYRICKTSDGCFVEGIYD
jgi:hypothetical protein